MHPHCLAARGLPWIIAFASSCSAVYGQTTPYPELDHIHGSLVLTAAAPVRPMISRANGDIWAINTTQNTIERLRTLNQGPLDIRQVPWGPVSIAEWESELLIVCRNTWGLLRMDRATGAFLEFIPMLAEPSDIVVDPTNDRAFVSCTGADAVVQVNLNVHDGQFHVRYDEGTTGGAMRIKSPYFLHLDGDGTVLVAPLHSGNNTTVPGDQQPGLADRVISLDSRTFQLPDEDLFRINPITQSVSVFAHDLGTILFAIGRNGPTGPYWVLNTDARNADPAAQGEPALGFDFVDNRITMLDSAGAIASIVSCDPDMGSPFTKTTAIGQPFAIAYHPTNGRAFVAGLLTDNVTMFDANGVRLAEIDLPDGSIPRGINVSPLDPRFITVYCFGTSRVQVYRIDHPATNPMAVGFFALSNDPLPADLKDGRRLFFDGALSDRGNVSCASCHVDGGTDFLTWNLSGSPYDDKGPMVTQTLIGLERVAPFHWRGERTFEDFNEFAFPGLLGHDADPSTPATHDPLDGADFAKMKAWLLALRNPANPYQNRSRVIDGSPPTATFIAPTQTRVFSSIVPTEILSNPLDVLTTDVTDFGVPLSIIGGNGIPGAGNAFNAVAGPLPSFTSAQLFESRFACVDCHSFPIGTNNDVTDDEPASSPVRPETRHFKNSPFHEIWRKKQSLVAVESSTPSSPQAWIDASAFLGAGLSHTGLLVDTLRFTQGATKVLFHMTNIAALIQQWDQGIAPAAHYAYWLNGASSSSVINEELVAFLLAQASATINPDGTPNCDIAVLQATSTTRRTWYLQRPQAVASIGVNDPVFVTDSDLSPDTRSLQMFINEAATTPSLFIGTPVGMAERFAVDFDMDGKKNRDEAVANLFVPDPNPDTTAPVFTRLARGYVSTNSARAYIQTNEPTTLEVSYTETGSSLTRTVTSPILSRNHSVLLTDLRPSTGATTPQDPDVLPESVSYSTTTIARDASGNSRTITVPNGVLGTDPFTLPDPAAANPLGSPFTQILHEHIMTTPPTVTVGLPNGAGNRLVTVVLTAHLKQGATIPAASRVFVVRAFREPAAGGDPVPLTVSGGGLVNTPPSTRIVNQVILRDPMLNATSMVPVGSLILNPTATDSSGTKTLQFRVAGSVVAPGDRVIVNVEAIVEVLPGTGAVLVQPCTTASCSAAELSVAAITAFGQWDFPRTSEHNVKNLPGTGIAP